MYSMNEQEMMAFMEWIPEAVMQLQDQLPQEFVQAVSQAQSVEEIDGILTEVSQSEEGAQLINALYQAFQQSNAQSQSQASLMAAMKKGGKIDYFVNCLAKGGSVDCNCNKVVKAQDGTPDGLRARGTQKAYRGDSEFKDDGTWTRRNGAHTKNIFKGKVLEQHVVTPGENGVPRRIIRTISNYSMPAQADTTYTDAAGLVAGRNPGFMARLFGNVHTPEFMDRVDAALVGADPYELNEAEVKSVEKANKKNKKK